LISHQTLTQLDLSKNRIGAKGARHLHRAQALQNTVTLQLLFHSDQISLLDLSLGAYTTQP